MYLLLTLERRQADQSAVALQELAVSSSGFLSVGTLPLFDLGYHCAHLLQLPGEGPGPLPLLRSLQTLQAPPHAPHTRPPSCVCSKASNRSRISSCSRIFFSSSMYRASTLNPIKAAVATPRSTSPVIALVTRSRIQRLALAVSERPDERPLPPARPALRARCFLASAVSGAWFQQ